MRQYLVLIIVSCFILSSCEEVIDLNLDTTEPRLVILGNIDNQSGPYSVTLSKTVDFDANSIYPSVSDALVIIADNYGNIDTLIEKSLGTYVTTKLVGTPGYTYTLTVVAEEKTYKAISTMPSPVDIDSIYTEENAFSGDLQIGIKFKDPANDENYYCVKQLTNNVFKSGFYTANDELYDGQNISFSIATRGGGPGSNDDNELNIGDSVTVLLESVDEGVYNYFRTAGENMAQSATPTNPLSNISNNALGYFNACAISSDSLVVE